MFLLFVSYPFSTLDGKKQLVSSAKFLRNQGRNFPLLLFSPPLSLSLFLISYYKKSLL